MRFRFGFVADGGFAAVDELRRVAAYAYPTSPNAEQATKQAEKTALWMLACESKATGPMVELYSRCDTALAQAGK